MLRGLKRMWRNKFGEKNNGGLKQGKLVADRQDLAKNDAAKAHRAMVTASTLQEMVGTPEGVQLMKALGFSGKRVRQYAKGECPSVEAIYGKLRKRD